jgi:hypothetical protein
MTKANMLMLFGDKIGVYYETRTKPINIFSGQYKVCEQ